MDVIRLMSDASVWLQNEQRWSLITLVICLSTLVYVTLNMLRRTRERRETQRAAVSDVMRLSARRYHETAWN
jgi:hypothetical protein